MADHRYHIDRRRHRRHNLSTFIIVLTRVLSASTSSVAILAQVAASSVGAPQVQQYSAKELEAWRSGTWSEWVCTNCQTVVLVWTKEVQALRGEKELRSSSFYDISSILERMDSTETKQLVTGLSAATTSGGTTTICMWKRSSTSTPKSGRAYCRVLWVWRGHTAN